MYTSFLLEYLNVWTKLVYDFTYFILTLDVLFLSFRTLCDMLWPDFTLCSYKKPNLLKVSYKTIQYNLPIYLFHQNKVIVANLIWTIVLIYLNHMLRPGVELPSLKSLFIPHTFAQPNFAHPHNLSPSTT